MTDRVSEPSRSVKLDDTLVKQRMIFRSLEINSSFSIISNFCYFKMFYFAIQKEKLSYKRNVTVSVLRCWTSPYEIDHLVGALVICVFEQIACPSSEDVMQLDVLQSKQNSREI